MLNRALTLAVGIDDRRRLVLLRHQRATSPALHQRTIGGQPGGRDAAAIQRRRDGGRHPVSVRGCWGRVTRPKRAATTGLTAIQTTLKSAGMTMDDLVEVQIFTPDVAN